MIWWGFGLAYLAGLLRRYDELALEPLLKAATANMIVPVATFIAFLMVLLPAASPHRIRADYPHSRRRRLTGIEIERGYDERNRYLFGLFDIYMLTAPCAVIYAIPVEQFLEPLLAAQMNIVALVFVRCGAC